jgi:transposase
MLKLDQYDYVRTGYRVYGKTIKEIARETGHSKNTVKKALKGQPCTYKEREKQVHSALGPYLKTIDSWLLDDKDKPKKQRHTATRIYNRLKHELGFSGSDRTVRHYVREAKVKLGISVNKVFIPLEPDAGREAEIDWGQAKAVIGGHEETIKFFCMRSKYSGKHFVSCYLCERQQAFFDAHIQAFNFFGGVFPVLIYDNLTTAVQKILCGKERILQQEYSKFKAFYNFTARFCNPGSGHEKGGVEGLVGYARRNYLVPIPHADSLETLNEQILTQCLAYGEHRISGREKMVNDYFEEEKGHLLSLPDTEYDNIKPFSGTVNKYSTLIIEKNHFIAEDLQLDTTINPAEDAESKRYSKK